MIGPLPYNEHNPRKEIVMRNMLLLLFLILILLIPLAAEAQVRIFVYARTEPGGFVDSRQLANSVADIRGNLAKRKGVALADSERGADIALEVLTAGPVIAGTESATQVNRGIFGGVQATTQEAATVLPSITARIHVVGSDYQKDIGYTGQRLWRVIAGYIGDQLIAWTDANLAQIQSANRAKP